MDVKIDIERLLSGCATDSFEDGIRIDTELVPLAGPGGPVNRRRNLPAGSPVGGA